MNDPSDINTALRKADPLVQAFVRSLRKENVKLQKALGALAAKLVSAENRIATLKKSGADPLDLLTPEQRRARMAQVQDEVGKVQDEVGMGGLLEKHLAELEKQLKK